ncbi:hypothetical protein D9757_005787 [Collybiopsis confluens]|uniref:ATP-dependent DNA helicase PIF1 n=1 Tax=Collybiopsis confluens TaxID=2823264 RepID=A0A8H5HQ47_9AGAR|nr:hypothetical protein D9757_005787 [Collybiopsis confluens]
MSTMTKSRSGLGTFKRDFSENTRTLSREVDPQESIEWPPSPPKVKLTGKELRMKAIEAALNGSASNLLSSAKSSQPLVESRTFNKRPSDPALFQDEAHVPPPKKRRELPASWKEDSQNGMSAPSRSSIGRSVNASVKPQIKDLPRTLGKSRMAGMFLSQEQSQILRLVEDGKSVFYTGSAGTGKSVLLREIIKSLKKKFKALDAVAITASTGIAACNIGGVTMHSFAGFGLGLENAKELASKVRKNKKATTRWARTQVLIIDEVSMVDGDLFDKLAEVGSILRKNSRPFGGIQMVVTGDFFQLPPVTKSGAVKFAFEATHWPQAIERTFNLTQVFRQKDPAFVNMLNEMRFGRLSQQSIGKFRSLSRNIVYEDGLGPTELFPRREEVDRSNQTRLNRLTDDARTFTAIDGGAVDGPQREKLLGNFMAPQTLVLRVEAQVMLIKNIDETLVNGSMGRIIRFADPNTYMQEGEIPPTTTTLSKPSSSTSKPGANARPTQFLPVVEFILPNGQHKEMLVMPENFKVELPSGEVQASRTQLPLILSWAMSIHKSQGQTLDRVKVDLGKVFEKGQAYVALSRATSLDGLQASILRASCVSSYRL